MAETVKDREVVAELLARWMPHAFESIHAVAKEHEVSLARDFGPKEQVCFRLVAEIICNAITPAGRSLLKDKGDERG